MAKQDGIIKITGTIDDITFYKMGDEYYARMKSSLTGKRFWKDKAFEGSRRSAGAMGAASKLASVLYKTLPKELKGRSVFQKLTGKIKIKMQNGLDADTIIKWFYTEYNRPLMPAQVDKEIVENKPVTIKAYHPSVAKFEKKLFAYISKQPGKQRQVLIALLE